MLFKMLLMNLQVASAGDAAQFVHFGVFSWLEGTYMCITATAFKEIRVTTLTIFNFEGKIFLREMVKSLVVPVDLRFFSCLVSR